MKTGRQDRIAGTVLASACGDALGAGYETGKPVPRSGATMCGGGFGFKPGEFTDDSQQSVCVLAARSDPLKVAANLLAWFRDPGVKDVGAQTAAIMRRASTPRGLAQASRAYARRMEAMPRPRGFDPGSGNGGLMRTGPVCLPFLGDRKRIASVARTISDLTHASAYDGDAAVLWSLAIDRAIELGTAFSAEQVADGLELIPAQRREYWEGVIDEALSEPPGRFRRNGGCIGCFKAALSSVAHAESLEKGLQLAVGIGGDTDTVAAVAGSLFGARFGASAVPAKWRRAVWGWPGMKAADLERLALQAASVQVSA
jgi:ADP-ribosyl-[dinitrogen reductase] hydrolase